MSSPLTVLSETLQSITATKFRELKSQQAVHEATKKNFLRLIDEAGRDRSARASALLAGARGLQNTSFDETLRNNVVRWLDQSRYDNSIPDSLVETFEDQLCSEIDFRSRKLSLGELYSRLLTEWIDKPTNVPEASDSFEILVKDSLHQLCRKFEGLVFTLLESDEVDIDLYLSKLFHDENSRKALKDLRNEMKKFGEREAQKRPFDKATVTWCLKCLFQDTLLSDEKKAILQDFPQNDLVLQDIADVLNMRFEDLKNWSWTAGKEGIPVMARTQQNGKTRINMDEDLVDTLFLHHFGTAWSVALKTAFCNLFDRNNIWKCGAHISPEEAERRSYYLDRSKNTGYIAGKKDNVESERLATYRKEYFLSHLPSVARSNTGYCGDRNTNHSHNASHQIKQQLLRQLTTDIQFGLYLHGEVAIIQSDLLWFASGLSHSSLCAIMRFIGIPEDYVKFFQKFLSAPLNMAPTFDKPHSTGEIHTRKRGVPTAHALEVFFGELILFFLDLAVNQKSSMLLYRQHDNLWLCGQPQKVANAWETMQDFAMVIGIEFNMHRTGSAYLTRGGKAKDEKVLSTIPKGPVAFDFLQLNPETGNWDLNQESVFEHVKQLRKQLAVCSSVLSWIQTWNAVIELFFGTAFGEPANCFGGTHVDNTLQIHRLIKQCLFPGESGTAGSAVEHLQRCISDRFNVHDVPDAFISMPEEFGGLGLHSPFVLLLLTREQFSKTPEQWIEEFFNKEKEAYKTAKSGHEALGESGRHHRYRTRFPEDSRSSVSNFPNGDIDTFMTFEDFTRWREKESSLLLETYKMLRLVPNKVRISLDPTIARALGGFASATKQYGLTPNVCDPERLWLVQLHAGYMMKHYGGLGLVERSLLPLGVLKMLKKRKIAW